MYKLLAIFILITVYLSSNTVVSAVDFSQRDKATESAVDIKWLIQKLGTGLTGDIKDLTIYVTTNTGTDFSSIILREWSGNYTSFSEDIVECSHTPSGTPTDSEIVADFNCRSKSFEPSKYYAIYIQSGDTSKYFKSKGSSTNKYANGSLYTQTAYSGNCWTNFSGGSKIIHADCTADANVLDLYFIINAGTNSYFQVDAVEASQSANLVYLDLSGDVATKSATTFCDISVFERSKTDQDIANWVSDTPIAHIKLDPNNDLTYTSKLYQNYYLGYGYSPTVSLWWAKRIEAPFHPSINMQYPISFYCYHDVISCSEIDGVNHCVYTERVIEKEEQGLYPTDDNYNSQLLIDTDDGLTGGDITVECGSFDVVCKMTQNITSFFKYWFIPDMQLSITDLDELRNDLKVRSPFAYPYAVFAMDWSSPSGATASPTISFPISPDDTFGLGSSISIVPANFVDNSFSTIRDILKIVVWSGFVVYLFLVSRRLFPA